MNGNSKRLRRIRVLLAVSMGALMLSSCAPDSDREPDDSTQGGTQTMSEWASALVSCLHERGWDGVEPNSDGTGITFDSAPRDNMEPFLQDRDMCREQVGPPPNDAPLTEEQIREIYRHQVKMVDCIEQLGYTISEPPPSETTFVEVYLSGAAPWHPYVAISESSESVDFGLLNEECPQLPE